MGIVFFLLLAAAPSSRVPAQKQQFCSSVARLRAIVVWLFCTGMSDLSCACFFLPLKVFVGLTKIELVR